MSTPMEVWLALPGRTPLVVVMDLDGTLLPFAETPGEADPDADLLELIAAVAREPGIIGAVVEQVIQAAFRSVRVAMHAWFVPAAVLLARVVMIAIRAPHGQRSRSVPIVRDARGAFRPRC